VLQPILHVHPYLDTSAHFGQSEGTSSSKIILSSIEGIVRCATIHNACRSAPFPRPTSKRSCQSKYAKIHSSFRAMPFPCSPLQSPRLSFLGSQVTDLIPVTPCAAFLSNRWSDPFLLIEFTDRCRSVDCIPLYLFSQAERSLSRMAHSAFLQFIFAT
jgi:hypothetical protein